MTSCYHFMLALTLGFVTTCQAAGIDACKLISADEAGNIMGITLTAHSMQAYGSGPIGSSMCRYSGAGIGSGFMLIAGPVNYADPAKEVARQEKEMLSGTPPGLPKPSFVPVKGLGSAAYLAKATGYFQLHVLAHGSAVVINRNAAATSKAVSQAKQIARVVLKRLK